MTGLEHYHKREWIDSSSLTRFVRCPRMFFYQYGCGLAEEEEHPALTYGSGLHAAIPYLHRGDLDEAMMAFEEVWGDKDDLADPKRNTKLATRLMESYMQSHSGGRSIYEIVPPPDQRLEIDDGISDDEIPFAIDVGLPIPLIGRIDACGRHRDTGDIYAVEYKTTSFLGTNFFMSFEYNTQILAYTLALSTMTDKPVKGAIVEGLQVAKTKCEVMSHPVTIEDWKLREFIGWMKRKVGLMLGCEASGEWPKSPCGCSSFSMFGGLPSFPCPFMSLCHQVEDWTVLKGLFRVDHWKPFKMKDKDKKHGSEETKQDVPDVKQSVEAEDTPAVGGE